MATIIKAPLEEAAGFYADRWRFSRAMQLLDFKKLFDEKRTALGITGELKQIPPKFGMPLLEAVAVEEDPDLLAMMAVLLANATDDAGQTEPRRSFVSILRDLEPLDAKVLLAAYNSPAANPRHYAARTVYTAQLPEAVTVREQGRDSSISVEPRPEVRLSLCNLSKHGCIALAGAWGGTVSTGLVTVTALGIALIEASTLPEQRTYAPPSASDASSSFR